MRISFGVKTGLTIWLVIVMAITLGILGFISYYFMSYRIYQNLDDTISVRVDEIVHRLKAGESISTLERFDADEVIVIPQPDLLLQQSYPLDFAGQIGSTSLGEIASEYNVNEPFEYPDYPMRFFEIRTKDTFAQVMVVGRSSETAVRIMDEYHRILNVAVPIALLVFSAGAYFLSWRALKPISNITSMAQEIQEKDLSRRLVVKKNDEVAKLARTLNGMFERLETAFKRERRFMADAAHELRTPLAVIQSEATGSLEREKSPQEVRDSMALISRETTYMSEIMRNLLLLARTEAGDGSKEKFVSVDLKALLTEIGEDMLALCQDRGLDFTLDAPKSLSVRGDELMLKRLFMNIFDNAVRYNRDDGKVEVSLRNGTNEAVVRISDTGLGIADADLPHVFERFYRGAKVSPGAEIEGTGLGMAIAQTIAELQGGQITVTSKVGIGSVFTVRLPIAE